MWSDIPGRAAYLWIYDRFVASAPLGATVIEVGVALGKSAAYLARKAIDAGRSDIHIIAVDPWAGTARNGEQQANGPPTPDGDYQLFLATMEAQAPEELQRITVYRRPSVEAAKLFTDASLDLVVIDAAHDYDSVKADIAAWLPKIKKGGAIGGDDYMTEYQGVIDAVKEAFPGQHIEVHHNDGWGTWRVQL